MYNWIFMCVAHIYAVRVRVALAKVYSKFFVCACTHARTHARTHGTQLPTHAHTHTARTCPRERERERERELY